MCRQARSEPRAKSRASDWRMLDFPPSDPPSESGSARVRKQSPSPRAALRISYRQGPDPGFRADTLRARRPSMPRYLGIDVGGTKLALAVGDEDGRILARRRRPTEPCGRPADDLERIVADARALVAEA